MESGLIQEHGKCNVCGGDTREGKPFCTQHIDHMPEVSALMSEIVMREEEVRLVSQPDGHKHVRLNGSIAKDVMGQLAAYRGKTLKRIMKECKLPEEAALNYAKALEAAGLVTTTFTGRGDIYLKPCKRKGKKRRA